MLLLLITGISLGFFIQTITGFAGALVSLPFLLFVMPLSDAIAYLSIFYSISTPIYVYKEWGNIDKSLLKKLALPSFIGLFIGIVVLVYGQPLILKKALGLFIILFVLNSLRIKKEILIISKMKYVFGFLGGFFLGYSPVEVLYMLLL